MKSTSISDSTDKLHARSRSPYLLWPIWIVWLPFMIPLIIGLFQSHTPLPHLILALVGIALFVGIYLWTSWRRAQQLAALLPPPSRVETWLPLIMLIALSIILILVNGKEWFSLFYFISGYVGGRMSIIRTIQVVGGLILILVALGLLLHIGQAAIGQIIFMVCAICIIGYSIMRSVIIRWELHAAQEEIARLAVTTERLRIARDLHDLLGHNLSLIALKSELARRLISVAPERAVIEIGDVEQVARTTLQEVREAVASYRQPTLPNELQSAQEILAAAGITYHYEGNDGYTLPTTIEAVLAWAVREGVTNIIRHGRAHQCTIRIQYNKRDIQLEITNDGTTASEIPIDQHTNMVSPPNRGTGLRGLAERVDTLGGQFDARPLAHGGFCLNVTLPLTQKAEQPDMVAQLTQQPDTMMNLPVPSIPMLSQVTSNDEQRSEKK